MAWKYRFNGGRAGARKPPAAPPAQMSDEAMIRHLRSLGHSVELKQDREAVEQALLDLIATTRTADNFDPEQRALPLPGYPSDLTYTSPRMVAVWATDEAQGAKIRDAFYPGVLAVGAEYRANGGKTPRHTQTNVAGILAQAFIEGRYDFPPLAAILGPRP